MRKDAAPHELVAHGLDPRRKRLARHPAVTAAGGPTQALQPPPTQLRPAVGWCAIGATEHSLLLLRAAPLCDVRDPTHAAVHCVRLGIILGPIVPTRKRPIDISLRQWWRWAARLGQEGRRRRWWRRVALTRSQPFLAQQHLEIDGHFGGYHPPWRDQKKHKDQLRTSVSEATHGVLCMKKRTAAHCSLQGLGCSVASGRARWTLQKSRRRICSDIYINNHPLLMRLEAPLRKQAQHPSPARAGAISAWRDWHA